MPEGPEIRLAADSVAKALVGRVATTVTFGIPGLIKYDRVLSGRTVTAVETRGKAMLTYFDDRWVVYSHNQLYGIWATSKKGEEKDSHRQLRLAIRNDQYSALLYSASDIDVMPVEKVVHHPFLISLGPDILSQNPSRQTLFDRFKNSSFRRRQFAGLLLNQRFVAGLGNYLRAEILWDSCVHPLRRPVDCSDGELMKLASSLVKLTWRSYKTGGIINPPSRVRLLKQAGKKLKEQHRFAVYGREKSHVIAVSL